jgi:uncharacterized protein
MAKLKLESLPLRELLEQLRDMGLPLGTGDYLTLREVLATGFGLESKVALEQLCCFIWAKSPQQISLIQKEFGRVMQQVSEVDETLLVAKEEPKANQETDQFNPEFQRAASDISPPEQPTPALTKISSLSIPTSFFLSKIEKRYSFSEYLPLSQREMKLGWRFLRRRVYDGPREELDIRETIEQSCKQGVYLAPVLKPRPRSDAYVTLLLDYGGSMAPFHRLLNNLIATAQDSGVFNSKNLEVYYFRNYPVDVLYTDHARIQAIAIHQVLANLSKRQGILIASDAGAARGNYDLDRVDRIADLIFDLKQKTSYLAWLNPLPPERWPGTPASLIARMTPMFPMDYTGFYQAIKVLRGRFI